MKKLLLGIMVLVLLLCGCASDKKGEKDTSPKQDAPDTEMAAGEDYGDTADTGAADVDIADTDAPDDSQEDDGSGQVAPDCTVLYEYTEEIPVLNQTKYCVVVTNDADYDAQIYVNAVGRDADGNEICGSSGYITVLGAGKTGAIYMLLGGLDIASIDYNVTMHEPSGTEYDSAKDIRIEAYQNKKNVVLAITNEGAGKTEYGIVHAFFKNEAGEIIHHDTCNMSDVDLRFHPGATIYSQIDCDEEYASVDLYYSAYGVGVANNDDWPAKGVTDDDLDVREYIYETPKGDSQCTLVLTNNSNESIRISVSGAAKDEDGNIIGADKRSFEMLYPGETDYAILKFEGISGVASVDYNLYYLNFDRYPSVLKNLSTSYSIEEDGVVVDITNNGSDAAAFVQTHILFFDADNQVVDAKEQYVVDSDSEIKPGNTESAKVTTKKNFDHVEIYLEGTGRE